MITVRWAEEQVKFPQVEFRRIFHQIKRPVPPDAEMITAYTDGQVTRRSARAREGGYHEAADMSGMQGVHVGDFVVHGLDIMRGSVGISDSTGAISAVCILCEANDKADPRYFGWVIRAMSFTGFPKALARGVREGGADFRRWDTLAELPVPCPPVDVQSRISDFLDKETKRIDLLILHKQDLIKILATRQKSLIASATRPASSSANGGDLIPLKRVAKFRNGRDYKEVEVEEGPYPVFGSGGEFARASEYLFDGESVLFGRKGTIDSPKYVNGPFWTVDTMYYTELTDQVSARYVYYVAQTIPFSFYATSTALPSMTQEDLGSHKIPVPSIERQLEIVRYLDAAIGKVEVMTDFLKRSVALLQERRQSLITAAVTGQQEI